MEKKVLRRIIKEKRTNMDRKTKLESDNGIKNKLFNLEKYKNAEAIFIYVSMDDEIDTREIIDKALKLGKKVFVPKTEGRSKTMYAVKINSLEELISVPPYNILEPRSIPELKAQEILDLIITPGLAFSEKGDRLGYGAGYYDRFIADYKDTLKVALAYEFQILESIPTQEHDEKVDIIISEKRVMKIE